MTVQKVQDVNIPRIEALIVELRALVGPYVKRADDCGRLARDVLAEVNALDGLVKRINTTECAP